MPCRCDGYAPSDAEHISGLTEKVKHLEGQLCNAQSLLHKILTTLINVVDNGNNRYVAVGELVSPALRERASKHIAILAAHKRKEHEADTAKVKERVERLRREHERELSIQQAAKDQLSQASARASVLEREIAEVEMVTQTNPSDKDLLG